MTRTCKAAVLRAIGAEPPFAASQPLSIETVTLDDPGPMELEVKVAGAGLCHSDLSVINGNRGREAPMVMGHEGSGVVTQVGSAITDISVGDHVVFQFSVSCGRCRACLSGRPNICEAAPAARSKGELISGGRRIRDAEGHTIRHQSGISCFAEYAVVHRGSVVVIDQDIPLSVAAVFGCAVMTGVGSVVNTAKVKPGESVAIFGLGGVGLSALMGARIAGARPLIAVDLEDAKLAKATELGATHAFNATDPDLIAKITSLTAGGVDHAIDLAGAIPALKAAYAVTVRGGQVITAGLAAAADYTGLLTRDDSVGGIGPWVDGLVKAWAQVGIGDVSKALAEFDRLGEEPGIRGFVLYHKALALASVGDFESAEAIFAAGGAGAAGQTRRGTIAHAEVLAALGQHEDAATLLSTSFADGTDPELDQLIAEYESGEVGAFDHVRGAQDGIAEVFFTFAAVLRSENAGDYYVLLYSRIARFLREDHVDALLLTASLLEALDQHDLAIEEYKAVPPMDPAYHAAELGRAGALRRSGRPEQAIEVLQQLTRSHGQMSVVHSTLGDALRSQEDFEGAIAAYDRAIERVGENSRVLWILNYSRGIAHERNDNMDAAEADFRAALALNPEQPQVLNYLGYSLVEEQRNMAEALDMIERAVKASPESGYIVDSLGWVFYRLGRYEEAVPEMEKAVELLPVDPVVNDHLGDVYWAVGRAREAEFQWSRALSFIDPDDTDGEADPVRIRRKIEVGLDQVLKEEGADPLKVANDG